MLQSLPTRRGDRRAILQRLFVTLTRAAIPTDATFSSIVRG